MHPRGAFPFSGEANGGNKLREQIEVLASLQTIDRGIQQKNEAKALLVLERQKWQVAIETKKKELEALRQTWQEKERLRQDRERTLQEESTKAVEKRMRMNRIKNIKELQALQREIEQLKQQNAVIEEELIKLLEETEAEGAAVKEKERELEELERQWEEKQAEIDAQLGKLDEEIAAIAKKRERLIGQVNGDLISRYEMIFRRRGGTAVVPAIDGICQGCYMNLPPQLYNEILKGERLLICPSCHRILYYEPATAGDKQP